MFVFFRDRTGSFPGFFDSKPVNNYTFEILGRHIREDGAAILIVFDRLIGIKHEGGEDWVYLRKRKKGKMKKIIRFGNAGGRIGACTCGTEFYFGDEDVTGGEVRCPMCGKNARIKEEGEERLETWTKECVHCGKEFEYTKYSTKKELSLYVDRYGIPRKEEMEWAECPKCGFPNLRLYEGEKKEVLLD